jgi:hypothetical protein
MVVEYFNTLPEFVWKERIVGREAGISAEIRARYLTIRVPNWTGIGRWLLFGKSDVSFVPGDWLFMFFKTEPLNHC